MESNRTSSQDSLETFPAQIGRVAIPAHPWRYHDVVEPVVAATQGSLMVATATPEKLLDPVLSTIPSRAKIGKTWVFDRRRIPNHEHNRCWWNPLGGIRSYKYALELARVFYGSILPFGYAVGTFTFARVEIPSYPTRDYPAAEVWEQFKERYLIDKCCELLAATFLAAATEGEDLPSMVERVRWVNYEGVVSTLAKINLPLAQRTAHLAAIRHLVIYINLLWDVFRLSGSASWLERQSESEEFDASVFAEARFDTLYVIGSPSCDPVSSMLADSVLRAWPRRRNRTPPRRKTAVIDNAGTSCRIFDLPNRFVDLEKSGVDVCVLEKDEPAVWDAWGWKNTFLLKTDPSQLKPIRGG